VIDLDGALMESRKSGLGFKKLKKKPCVCAHGGGIRNMNAIDAILKAGIDRVIFGSVVFRRSGWPKSLLKKYKNQVFQP